MKNRLEQEAAGLHSKLSTIEQSLEHKNQRCLELDTLSEKYLAQKIGKINQIIKLLMSYTAIYYIT